MTAMHFRMVLLLGALAAAACRSDRPRMTGQPPQDPESLIAQLGSPDFSAREAAQHELWNRGVGLQTLLVDNMGRQRDEEIRARLKTLIDNNSAILDVSPPPLEVHWLNATPAEVQAALSRQYGLRIISWNCRPDLRFTLEGSHPLWDILQELGRQSTGGGGALDVGQFPRLPIAVLYERHGGFSVFTWTDDERFVYLTFAADPRIFVKSAHSHVSSITDASGRLVGTPSDEDSFPGPLWLSTTKLDVPRAFTGGINISGECTVTAILPGESWAVDDLAAKIGKPVPIGPRTFQVNEFRVKSGIVNMIADLKAPARDITPLEATLFDATGAATWRSAPPGISPSNGSYGMSAGPGPYRMQFCLATATKTVTIPFSLHLQLP